MNIDLKILSAFDLLDKKIKELSSRFDGLSKEAKNRDIDGEIEAKVISLLKDGDKEDLERVKSILKG